MAPQHDYVVSNGSGSAVRSDLNGALAAIVSLNSGASQPTDTFAYMLWADTTAGVLKIRNATNNAWITLRELDGTLLIEAGSASTPGLYFAGDTNTGIYSPGADQFGIATNGVDRTYWTSTALVINEVGADYDVRIEGDTNVNLFYLDASTDRIGFGTNVPSTGFHIALPAASATIGNVYIAPSTAGQARGHIYNGGAQAEWLFGQKTSTDHSFKISKQVAGVESDYLELTTTGLLKVPNGIEGGITAATAVASTSGTAIDDFTNIPSWVKRITVMFDNVSFASTSSLFVQLGDSGGIETSGYAGGRRWNGSDFGGLIFTSSFSLAILAASDIAIGHAVITKLSGNTWVLSSVIHRSDNFLFSSAGAKTLSGTLDAIRVGSSAGEFDLGSINIFMEG
jgi:hypothetical protein